MYRYRPEVVESADEVIKYGPMEQTGMHDSDRIR